MNSIFTTGLTVTIALSASVIWSQDFHPPAAPRLAVNQASPQAPTPPPPPDEASPSPPEIVIDGVLDGVLDGVFDGVIDGIPGGVVGGVPGGIPMAPPELLGPDEPVGPPELLGPDQLVGPPELLGPDEPVGPLDVPEPLLAPMPPPADLNSVLENLKAIKPKLAGDDLKRLLDDLKSARPLLAQPDLDALMAEARAAGEQAKVLADQMRPGLAFALQAPPRPPHPDESDRFYERGQHNLERNRWDEAVDNFTEVVSRGGSRADGALYWKAYALNKLGRREEALAAIAELRKSYPSSRWLDDAKALEIEVKQAAGKPVSPDSSDEELKLMALNGLVNSDPNRAVPMIEKLLHSSQSLKVKERSLFVLTQSGSPQARQLVVDIAKGGSNPDLQMKAVNYLGVMGARKELGEVYGAANDVAVKRAVLNGLMVAGAKDQLLAAARGEKNPDLQRYAINQLGVLGARHELADIYKMTTDMGSKRAVINSWMVAGAKDELLAAAKAEGNADLRGFAINQLGVLGAQAELWQLYQAETSAEIKRRLINAFFVGGASDRLLEIARTAKEAELRRDAINRLGTMGVEHTGSALVSMYSNESDPSIRKAVINALFVQGNSHALVELARKETNVELKKEIVQRLSNMGSKEGTDYLMELLNK